MKLDYNPNFPDVESLRKQARRKIPGFAFEYVDGGCNEEVNLRNNTADIRNVELKPVYLKDFNGVSLNASLFGHTYSAPFGIAPVGLQGLIWPGAPELLAQAAYENNIPFILSTVTTCRIEKIAEITNGQAWFQLYHPAEKHVTDNILERLEQAGYNVLVLLADVPSFGYRPKEIRNGLAMPPRMTLRNMVQIASRPEWALRTLIHGQPEFATLKPYMPKGMNMHHLGLFMNKTFNGRLTEDKIRYIRDKWKGKLVIKGIASEYDAEQACRLGLDGLIVSNHGGRQLDAGESAIHSLKRVLKARNADVTVMMDSGIRSGPDIARTLASGASFTFLGRAFMYGVAALGKDGAGHTIHILKKQLQQVMEQLSCHQVGDLPEHLIERSS
ncbi:MAG: alpha-hydroxy-acid oxidizing protein [Pedobacter sp.]|nr:MAG: alpha-hydroxy-acid oxidizing protein [Pedobacter sp.]